MKDYWRYQQVRKEEAIGKIIYIWRNKETLKPCWE
jgi:hypothetical protein